MVCYNFVTTLPVKGFFFSYVLLFMISVISRIIVTASHSKIIIQMSPKSHHRHSTRQNTSSQQANSFTHKQSTSQNIYTQAIKKPKHLHTNSQQAKTFTHKQSTSHTSRQQAKTFTHKQSPSQNIYTQAVNKQKHSHTSSQQAKTFTSSQ